MSKKNISILNNIHEQLIECENDIDNLLEVFSNNTNSQISTIELLNTEETLKNLYDGFSQYISISLAKIDDMKNTSSTKKKRSSLNLHSFTTLNNFDEIVRSKVINFTPEIVSDDVKEISSLDSIDLSNFND